MKEVLQRVSPIGYFYLVVLYSLESEFQRMSRARLLAFGFRSEISLSSSTRPGQEEGISKRKKTKSKQTQRETIDSFPNLKKRKKKKKERKKKNKLQVFPKKNYIKGILNPGDLKSGV